MRNVKQVLGLSTRPLRAGLRGRSKPYLLGLGLLLALAVGCTQGTYPLDIFYEMHYQPSYRPYEPPRLSVPESAVPWFPRPQATSFTNDGAHLFEVNCSMCHGPAGRGDGPVLQRMINVYGYQPAITPDLTADQVKAAGVPGITAFMINGVVVMPSFAEILTDEEMQLIAEYVVNCVQGAQPQACP